MTGTNNKTNNHIAWASWLFLDDESTQSSPKSNESGNKKGWLAPIRTWIDNIKVDNPKLAHFICRSIPAQCPFERKIEFRGKVILSIPPLCKLNPLYEEVVFLRFRAISYLAEQGENIEVYYR